jgi:activator of HSP90 ATPase
MKKIIHQLNKKRDSKIKDFFTPVVLIIAIFTLQLPVIAQNKQDSISSIKACTIHQEVDFTVGPQQLYNALLDTKQFCEFAIMNKEFSNNSAQIDPSVGGAFILFDGHIIGRNIELVPNQRIVQAWRVVDWPAGVYSVVVFKFRAQGTGTHLVFDHTGFPDGWRDRLAKGWYSHYWDLLTNYFAKK